MCVYMPVCMYIGFGFLDIHERLNLKKIYFMGFVKIGYMDRLQTNLA